MAAKRESTASPRKSTTRVHVSPRTRKRAPIAANPLRKPTRDPKAWTRGPALTAKNLFSKAPGDHTDAAVAGLTLRVLPSGARLWALRYRAHRGAGRGPQRRLHFGTVGGPATLDLAALGLGSLAGMDSLGLEGARTVARALLGLAARGVDAVEVLEAADRERRNREAEAERRRTLGTETLGALLDRFIAYRADPPKEARERAIRPATLAGWQSLSRGALAALRDLDPATLTARDVRRWHERVGVERGRVIANRALELLAVLYAWAMRTEDEAGEPLLSSSPVGGVKPFAETPRARVLDSAELKKVWLALDGEPYGDALRLLLWSGARRSEATGAEWKEVDFKARLWRVPAERSKTGEPRSIPLSTPALRMLLGRREADAEGRWIFPSPVGAVGPVGSLQSVVRRVQERSKVTGWTIHDLRRVVRSGLAALGIAPPIAEFVLGHLPPRMTRTYDRHEPIAEAAVALEAWARRIESYVSPETAAGEVVPFTRGR